MISRSLFILCLTFVLTTGCSRPQLIADEPPAPPPTAATDPAPEPEPTTPAALPPETQAIVASAGPDGLFDPPRGDLRMVVISDLNGVYGSTTYDPEVAKAVKLLPFWQPDLVLCSGDMVGGQSPTLTPEQIRAMWAAFDRTVAAPLRAANLPYGFTMGNHDASGARGRNGGFVFQQERTLAAEYWQDPAHDPGIEIRDRADFPFYYSFEQGGIFFLVWDGS
ncbi:MAG: metallophosphoesterase, partial [Cyanobacteria bacterium J06641_5]